MGNDTLYIDVDEEIPSVIDKLKASGEKAVLLVVPKGATLLQSVVNLKLLKKEAEERGKDIALVTADEVGRNLASRIGLPVYQDAEGKELVAPPAMPERPPTDDVIEVDMSGGRDPAVPIHHYQGKPLSTPREAVPAHTLPKSLGRWPLSKRLTIIGAALFLLALLGLLFFYPRTTVVLGVKSEPLQSVIELTIDKNVTELNQNSSILPGTEIIVEKEKTTIATATGRRTVGDKAKGTVTVKNCYQSVPLTLASGTILTSTGKSFVTTAAVTVPAAVIIGSNCTTAGEQNAPIEAVDVGDASNLAANSTFCLAAYPCSGGTYVNAQNAAALSGGTSREEIFLKQEDIDAASNTAKDELFAQAVEEVKATAGEKGLRVLDAALDQQVTDKLSERPADTVTNDAKVTTKVRVRTLAFNEQDYRTLIVNLLSLRLPEGKKLLLSPDDEIATTIVEANWDQGFIKVRGDIKTNVAEEIDEERVKSLAKNSSVGAAEEKLRSLPGVVEVTIETSPRFLNRTALFQRNITVQEEAKSAP